MATPYMGLTEPTVLVTTGPQWATMLNTITDTIDAHDHSSGKGKQVPVGGGNSGAVIAGDFSFTGFGPVNMSWARFTAQALPVAGTKPASLLVNAAGDLYYEDTSSRQVAIVQGGAIVPSGTGLANGFFNFGGSGYANIAQVGFDQPNLRYLFYRDTVQTSLANAVFGQRIILAGAANQRILFSANGKNASPTNGFYIESIIDTNLRNNGFSVWTDTSGAGGYAQAMQVQPLSINNQNRLGVNSTSGYATGAALQVSLVAAQNTTPQPYLQTEIRTFGAGAPSGSSFGGEWRMMGATTAASTTETVSGMASIQHLWNNVASRTGELRLYTWAGGTIRPLPAFLARGDDSANILTATTTAGQLTIGATTIPSVTATYDFGATGTRWRDFFGRNLDFTGNGTVGGTLGVTGAITGASYTGGAISGTTGVFSSTVAATSTVTGSIHYATSTAVTPTASQGGQFRTNQVLFCGEFNAAGNVGANGFNTNGNASIASTSQYTINLATPVADISRAFIIATVRTNDTTNGYYAHAQWVDTDTFTVTTWQNNTLTAVAFNVAVIGYM